MKKILSFLTAVVVLLYASASFATVGIRNNGTMVGTATDLNFGCGSGLGATITSDGSIFNINCSTSLQETGVANGGATSLATVDTGLPITFAYVRKAISNLGTLTDTLANGIPGQMMLISITSVTGSGTWTITPTTATGWKTIAFNAAGQSALLTYANDTQGWLYPITGSTASANDPTIALSAS